jgi:hypothetical protein
MHPDRRRGGYEEPSRHQLLGTPEHVGGSSSDHVSVSRESAEAELSARVYG